MATYEQLIDRIKVIDNKLSIGEILGGNPRVCPICRKGNLSIWSNSNTIKCWSPSCSLNKLQHSLGFYTLYTYNSLDWSDKLRSLKEIESRFGIEHPSDEEYIAQVNKKRNERHIILDKVLDAYHYNLMNDKVALSYLRSRGWSTDIIERERMGYADANGNIRRWHLEGISLEMLRKHRLINSYTKGSSTYDIEYFINRVIFPIRSIGDQLVHFIGRDLSPKANLRYKDSTGYELNSKNYLALENYIPQYSKSSSSTTLIVCEGYPDALSLRQFGLPSVGLLGLEGLMRHSDKLQDFNNLTFIFDNDRDTNGNYKSWSKIIPQLINLQVELRSTQINIHHIPDQYKDVNDWVLASVKRGRGEEYIRSSIGQATDLVSYLIQNHDKDYDWHYMMIKLCTWTGRCKDEMTGLFKSQGISADNLIEYLGAIID